MVQNLKKRFKAENKAIKWNLKNYKRDLGLRA